MRFIRKIARFEPVNEPTVENRFSRIYAYPGDACLSAANATKFVSSRNDIDIARIFRICLVADHGIEEGARIRAAPIAPESETHALLARINRRKRFTRGLNKQLPAIASVPSDDSVGC